MVFPAESGFFRGVHKIGAAISGPRIADTNFTDTRIFLMGSTAFRRRRFSQNFEGNRRFPQETADFRRNPFFPFSLSLLIPSSQVAPEESLNAQILEIIKADPLGIFQDDSVMSRSVTTHTMGPSKSVKSTSADREAPSSGRRWRSRRMNGRRGSPGAKKAHI